MWAFSKVKITIKLVFNLEENNMSKMPSINILGDVLSDLHYKKHVDEELIKSAHTALFDSVIV